MWLFAMLATYYCQSPKTQLYLKPTGDDRIYPVCQLSSEDEDYTWSYFSFCYDHKTSTTKYAFDYCECHVPEEGEIPIYSSYEYKKAVFCHNVTATPKIIVRPTRTKRTFSMLSFLSEIIFIE